MSLNNDQKQKYICNFKKWLFEHGFFVIAVTAAFTVLLFICGPLYIYFPNSEEIWVSLSDILMSVGVVSLTAFFVLTFFFFILKDKISEFLILLTFGTLIGMYVQGLINIRYGSGVLDGSEIEWSKYVWYGVVDSIVWIVCILIPFIIRRVFSRNYKTIIVFSSCIIICMQLFALVVQFIRYKPNEQVSVTDDKLYEISADSNMLIFILDTMDEAYYNEFLENNNDYKNMLEGFVHYDNTFTSGARTILGAPSMLTGVPYRNEEKYSNYIETIWNGENPIRTLHDQGVDIGIYAGSTIFSSAASDYVENLSKEGAELKSHVSLAKKIYKLTGFTYFPHVFKPYLLKNAADFDYLKKEANLYKENDAKFYSNFIKGKGYKVSDDYSKAMRVYFLNGAHKPYNLDSKGKRQKETSRQEQVEGVFKIMSSVLDDLKEKNLYDSSYIVITADHGDLNLCENPFLLIKEPEKKDNYSTSHVPVSLFDIPVCMGDCFGIEVDHGEFGSSLNDLYDGQVRERHMFYNYRGSMQLQVNEYVTTGYANDRGAITLYKEFEDSGSGDVPYKLGTKLKFDIDGSANAYSVEGISGSTGWQSLMYGPESLFILPLQNKPKGENIVITIRTGNQKYYTEGLNYNIFVNGIMTYQGITDKSDAYSDIKIVVPIDEVFSRDENNIEIKWFFSDLDEDEMEMDLLERTKTYPLQSICVDAE